MDAGKEAAVHISADLANEVEAEAGEAGLAALCEYKPGFLLHSCKFGHLILLSSLCRCTHCPRMTL